MKKALTILIVVVFFIVLLGLLVLKLFSPSTKPAEVTSGTSFPVATSIQAQDQTSFEIQQEKQAFKNKIINSNQITLGRAKIISDYAIQDWGDENKGGEALLRYDTQSGWQLVSMGGGVWDVSSLVELGVPESIARQLLGV